jgi:hypothetical protein
MEDGRLDPGPMPSRQLTALLSRALLDVELSGRLFADPEAVAREFNLPDAEIEALRLLDRRKFEQILAGLRGG